MIRTGRSTLILAVLTALTASAQPLTEAEARDLTEATRGPLTLLSWTQPSSMRGRLGFDVLASRDRVTAAFQRAARPDLLRRVLPLVQTPACQRVAQASRSTIRNALDGALEAYGEGSDERQADSVLTVRYRDAGRFLDLAPDFHRGLAEAFLSDPAADSLRTALGITPKVLGLGEPSEFEDESFEADFLLALRTLLHGAPAALVLETAVILEDPAVRYAHQVATDATAPALGRAYTDWFVAIRGAPFQTRPLSVWIDPRVLLRGLDNPAPVIEWDPAITGGTEVFARRVGYPSASLQDSTDGRVRIGTDGSLASRIALYHYPDLPTAEAVLEAVRTSSFQPAFVGGEAVETEVFLQVEFDLDFVDALEDARVSAASL
ncbi:hypothetical protein [Rubrivirga sp.]|uniref:hypothetical protein n=1 Tax=Rubrivirga sp. TaxID=1885344 RepID=UPI003C73FB40